MSTWFPLSEDDAVWMYRLEGTNDNDLIDKIGLLLREPENFLKGKVDTEPMFKHIFQSKLQGKSLEGMGWLKDFFEDNEIRNSVERGTVKDFDALFKRLSEQKKSPLLFKWSDPVTIIFHYGEIKNVANNSRIPENTVLIQGEYGTNTIRVSCPIRDSEKRTIDLDLSTQIILSLTDTDICYVHYDFYENNLKAQSIFAQIAKIALFPGVQTKFMNLFWLDSEEIPPGNLPVKAVGNIQFSKELKAYIRSLIGPVINPIQELRIMNTIESTIKKRIIYKILGFDGVKNPGGDRLRYDFIFQTKSRVAPPGVRPENSNLRLAPIPDMSTCNKIISELSDINALKLAIQEALAVLGYTVNIANVIKDENDQITRGVPIEIYLDSGQMIRWILQ